MPIYIPTTLKKFQQKPLSCAQDSPNLWNKPVYVKHIQFATQQSSAPKLNSAGTHCVQFINGNFLYYARAVDSTIIPDINNISTWQSAMTKDTMEKFNQVLDYASTYPNTTIWYHPRYMIIITDTDSSFLILPESPHPAVAFQATIIIQTVCLIIIRLPPFQTALF